VSPEVEAHVPILFAALYESVAAHAWLGLDVVMDVNHHESYSSPHDILRDCARRLTGLPVLFAGVRCPADVIAAVELAQIASHAHGRYDLEIDTSVSSPAEGAELIRRRLAGGPPGSAFPTHAGR
jgi:chloramphenicol 3-O phosphotransferase